MSQSSLKVLEDMEKEAMRKDFPQFAVGDTIRVKMRVTDDDKERIQCVEWIVLGKSGGSLSETMELYRFVNGVCMSLVVPLHSPRIQSIEVKKRGVVRRAKLYFLQGRSGKKAKIKERAGGKR